MIVCENDIQARTLKDINNFIKEKDLKFNTELEFLGLLYKAKEEKRLSDMHDNYDHDRLMEIITDRKHGNKAECIADYILAESRSLLATIKVITALKTLLKRYKELENE
jgi:hypothetical protein